MTIQNDKNAACLLGALVADAAALGQHWIYDVERIAEVTAQNEGKAAFVPIDAENYEGVRSYFAHGRRADGMLSQYGESLRIAIRSMIQHGGAFDRENYQHDYVDTFGAGGTYQGYIDRPTRGTLENIAGDNLDPSGIDDDQLPAICRLPAIVTAYRNSDSFDDEVENAIRVTNVNDDASGYGHVFADLLSDVLDGANLGDAMQQSVDEAPEDIQKLLNAALTTDETSSVAYGEVTSRACHLPMGMPLMFHIFTHTNSFAEAVEMNILAGGDSCGRSIMLGALAGAAFGVGEEKGIPLEWVLNMHDASTLWQECRDLAETEHRG